MRQLDLLNNYVTGWYLVKTFSKEVLVLYREAYFHVSTKKLNLINPFQNSPADHNKLEDMVRELSTALTSVKHEQEYMEVRERVHRSSKYCRRTGRVLE